MPSICRVDIGRGADLYTEIEKKLLSLAGRIRQKYRVDRILLFGSFVRRDLNEGSDIDLLIVGDFPFRFHERPSLILDLTDLPIEPLCYTPKEFDNLLVTGNPFIASVLEEAVDL